MIFITSAAYVDPQFFNEFGALPPALLPVGNKRLIEHQIEVLKKRFPSERIYLTLPSSYEISKKDMIFLCHNKIEIIKIDENLSLAKSICFAISRCDSNENCLRILHGDTLLENIPLELDLIAISDTRDDYIWEVESVHDSLELVWCGYFAFSDLNLANVCFSENYQDFVGAVRKYSDQKPMKRYLVDTWHDFGHINTYFQSRTKVTTERVFNTLRISNGCVCKTSSNFSKIKAESTWFENAPKELRIYFPQLIDYGIDEFGRYFYTQEYLSIPPLNEIYVHGRNPVFFWNKIFSLCIEFLNTCKQLGPPSCPTLSDVHKSYRFNKQKTIIRLDNFFEQYKQFNWDTTLNFNGREIGTIKHIMFVCLRLSKRIPVIPGVLHGDLCLSNILFDSRSDRIKVIDPRGLDVFGNESNLGDLTYDFAKLSHSIIGLYDHIIAGAYELNTSFSNNEFKVYLDIFVDDITKEIQNNFFTLKFDVLKSPLDVMPLTVLLFLSMLPLHVDNPDRQFALFANAMRLYSTFIMKDQTK